VFLLLSFGEKIVFVFLPMGKFCLSRFDILSNLSYKEGAIYGKLYKG
jgi:hypothetical protein